MMASLAFFLCLHLCLYLAVLCSPHLRNDSQTDPFTSHSHQPGRKIQQPSAPPLSTEHTCVHTLGRQGRQGGPAVTDHWEEPRAFLRRPPTGPSNKGRGGVRQGVGE